MKKNIGLWLDHKKAVMLVLAGENEEFKKIESNVEKHIRFRGGARGKTPYAAQYYAAEDHGDKRLMGQLNKYYGEIIGNLRGAESILIMGPGEAKHELEARMVHDRMDKRIAEIATTDKVTDRQFMAKVRRYFQEASAGSSRTGTRRG